MTRAKAGPLVTEILNHLFEMVNKKMQETNVFVYAGHDLTLSTITRALGVEDQLPGMIKVASALAIELHRGNGTGLEGHSVRVSDTAYYFTSRLRTLMIPISAPLVRPNHHRIHRATNSRLFP